jgi:hypothetical protein
VQHSNSVCGGRYNSYLVGVSRDFILTET